jgi:DNA-binding MarR family transcriptional regulator
MYRDPVTTRTSRAPATARVPTDAEYRALLALRDGLRTFLRWSAAQAEAAGLTPAHHQLLLVVRAHGDPSGPTIGDVAEHLLLRHHSAVELVDRAASEGLVRRRPDPDDHRTVRLELTPLGRRRLEELSGPHLEELRRMGGRLRPLWAGLEPER